MMMHQYLLRECFFAEIRAVELLRTKEFVLNPSDQFQKSSALFDDKNPISLTRVCPQTKGKIFSLIHTIDWKKLLQIGKKNLDTGFDKFNLMLSIEDMISEGLKEKK